MFKPKLLISHYVDLLHKHKHPDSIKVVKFKNRHSDDKLFLEQVEQIDKSFRKYLKLFNELKKEEIKSQDDRPKYSWFSNVLYSFERWLDRHNHKMELIRTLASLTAAILSGIVLLRLFGVI